MKTGIMIALGAMLFFTLTLAIPMHFLIEGMP
jgi:hypothetical protein